MFLYPTNETEIERLIDGLKRKNSSGYDNISNCLLKDLQSCLIQPLTIIFNKSMTEGLFPTRMKSADVIPLYKSKDKTNKNNYRPISLLITLSKLLEKVIYKLHTTSWNLHHKSMVDNLDSEANTAVKTLYKTY